MSRAPMVYAMWDLHSLRVAPEFSPVADDVVIRTDPVTLHRGSAFLPENTYVFDESEEWTAALTHEWVDGQRFCLWSGREP